MNKSIFSQALSSILETEDDRRAESFTMINVRPGEKVAAMLDILAYLSKKTPSTLIAEALSTELKEYACSSISHADAILDAVEVLATPGMVNSESALGLLKKEGSLTIRNPYMKDLQLL
jgi:hypothetical protein